MNITATKLKLHTDLHLLEIHFNNNKQFHLPCEYLRVYTPSAEATGHGNQPRKFFPNKEKVNIKRMEPVGYYAIKLVFTDHHNSGLYTWEYLYELCSHFEEYWSEYQSAKEAMI